MPLPCALGPGSSTLRASGTQPGRQLAGSSVTSLRLGTRTAQSALGAQKGSS